MKRKGTYTARLIIIALFAIMMIVGPTSTANSKEAIMLVDNQVKDIVRRSYQYVAMYNVNNKFAITQSGWNTINPDTELKDHTMQDIARPNNDTVNGFFIPNERKKYSVGENAGMKLNTDGGIEIYIAAEKPEGVPEENWLPINRKDENLDIILRIYAPNLEKMKTWKAPKAEKL